MMVIKGSGGEGKSQIGAVLSALFGSNMKDGSIGKISENRFARADLEHILLCIDDDMRMEALRQTNYVKSIVTAQGKMDLERKGKQSYQGWMCARLLAFSNGDLQALFDRSDGFYRRQLVLTTKEKPADRVDDPDLAEKMKAEIEGIFLWAFAGLQRLVANNFKFTESQRTRENREAVKRDNNNVFDFLESEGYIRLKADASISSKDCYDIYRMWCEENSLTALKRRSFSDALVAACSKYNLEYCNTITNSAGRRMWGFMNGYPSIPRAPNMADRIQSWNAGTAMSNLFCGGLHGQMWQTAIWSAPGTKNASTTAAMPSVVCWSGLRSMRVWLPEPWRKRALSLTGAN